MRSLGFLPIPSSPLPSPSSSIQPTTYNSLSLPRRRLLFTPTTNAAAIKEDLFLHSNSSLPPPIAYYNPPFIISNGQFQEEEDIELSILRNQKLLSELSSWGIGGPCNYFLRLSRPSQLISAIQYCRSRSIEFVIIGNGSNCLFSDQGFDGLVMLNRLDHFEVIRPGIYKVGSGYPFNRLGVWCSNEGFSGLEFAGGIPGTVGGAAFMNAGADGQETGDVIDSVDIVTTDGEVRVLQRNQLAFGYRWSSFQEMEDLAAIVAVTFRLIPGTTARERQRVFLKRRMKTQPIGERNAGSVFRNPLGLEISAAELIELAGLKGYELGGAKVSGVHANFFVNFNSSTSWEMLALINFVKERVDQMFGIQLKEEVKYVPAKNQTI